MLNAKQVLRACSNLYEKEKYLTFLTWKRYCLTYFPAINEIQIQDDWLFLDKYHLNRGAYGRYYLAPLELIEIPNEKFLVRGNIAQIQDEFLIVDNEQIYLVSLEVAELFNQETSLTSEDIKTFCSVVRVDLKQYLIQKIMLELRPFVRVLATGERPENLTSMKTYHISEDMQGGFSSNAIIYAIEDFQILCDDSEEGMARFFVLTPDKWLEVSSEALYFFILQKVERNGYLSDIIISSQHSFQLGRLPGGFDLPIEIWRLFTRFSNYQSRHFIFSSEEIKDTVVDALYFICHDVIGTLFS